MAIRPKVQPASGICAELNVVIDDYAGPISYQTGGVTVSAAMFGLQKIKHLDFMDMSSDASSRANAISPPAGASVTSLKILWLIGTSDSEYAPGTNLSSKRIRFTAYGV